MPAYLSVLEVGDKKTLIITLPDDRFDSFAIRSFYNTVEQVVASSRAFYDAVVILSSSSNGLARLPLAVRRIVTTYNFKPCRGHTKNGKAFGGSYWIMELRS